MDSYSVAEASRLLGVSEKRVRQLVAGSRLVPVEGSSPLRIEAKSVLQERERRKESPPRTGPAPGGSTVNADEVFRMASEIASSVARESVRLALESAEPVRKEAEAIRDRTEEALRLALAEAEARATTAEERLQKALGDLETVQGELEDVRRRLQDLPLEPRRFWKRGK